MMWSVPPTRYPRRRDRFSVSATTPSPGKAASPCTTIGSTLDSSRVPLVRCSARATPSSTGFTNSRWLGFGTSSSSTTLPLGSVRAFDGKALLAHVRAREEALQRVDLREPSEDDLLLVGRQRETRIAPFEDF